MEDVGAADEDDVGGLVVMDERVLSVLVLAVVMELIRLAAPSFSVIIARPWQSGLRPCHTVFIGVGIEENLAHSRPVEHWREVCRNRGEKCRWASKWLDRVQEPKAAAASDAQLTQALSRGELARRNSLTWLRGCLGVQRLARNEIEEVETRAAARWSGELAARSAGWDGWRLVSGPIGATEPNSQRFPLPH